MGTKTMTRLAVAAVLLVGMGNGWSQRMTLVASGDGRTLSLTADGAQPGENGQVKDDLMDGLDRIGANAKEKNEVNLDKNMMALAHRGTLSQKMDMIVVRNYEFAARGQYSRSDLDALRHKLEGNGWSHLVRNESDGETNDIVVKSTPDGFISDMVILNAEPREVNVVHLRGHFKMEDVNGAMGSAMGMGGGMFGMAQGMGHMGGGTSSHSSSSSSTHSSFPPSPPAAPVAPAPPR